MMPINNQFVKKLKLPPELTVEIAGNLSSRDLAALAKTVKYHWHLFQPILNVRKLVRLVARGEENAAKAMLKTDIDLLLKKEHVTDYSGRTFDKVSAFQYALWAMDSHMWQMMLECLQEVANEGNDDRAEEIKAKLLAQYKEVQEKGLNYTLNDEAHTHVEEEHHFNFQPLLDALDTYAQDFDQWTWPQREDHWNHKVGGAQRLVPAHIAQEYCHPDFPFNSFRSFKEADFPRELTFYNQISDKMESWFPLSEDNGLGFDFAIYNGHSESGAEARVWKNTGWSSQVMARFNCTALSDLYEVRTQEVVELEKSLSAPSKKEDKSELPPELKVEIAGNLSSRDMAAFSQSSTNHYRLFQPIVNARKSVHFVHLVALGEENAAKAMLKTDIDLLLKKERITDYSGRTFDKVSAFQYALWAMDSHMWQMMLECLQEAANEGNDDRAEEIRAKLLAQYKEVQDEGVNYTLNDKTRTRVKGESHFNFRPLLDALATYVQHFSQWKRPQREEHWCRKIGSAQRLVPAHVAQEYCRSDRQLDKFRSFKEDDFPRELGFFNKISKKIEPWFPLSRGHGLGINFAIYNVVSTRKGATPKGAMTTPEAGKSGVIYCVARCNLTALFTLCEVRTQEIAELGESLLTPLQKKDKNEGLCL
ncbi:hypothetical protein E3983_05375 [Legionella israelensis]|uniref:F-box domain-containing protein n=1 Tax=Legionella israelensis TaxID=454 RepID=A0AAX1EFC2_9GAMM|nr:hypothetical protein [Legionella israelensis]QBR83806.1 hypothetical protein E3983_05250 [Legionella israelensis]QBR83826.1 hypothetical protein E3983_05375 [Legionella israelensis]